LISTTTSSTASLSFFFFAGDLPFSGDLVGDFYFFSGDFLAAGAFFFGLLALGFFFRIS